jgi:DNA repair exonuclease SbcCD ATPase subunit
MLDNNIEDLKAEDIESEQAAVKMLLAAAQEALVPSPVEPVPVGDINTLHALSEQQKQLGEELKSLASREADLLRQLQAVRDETTKVEQQLVTIKTRASEQFEAIFGKPEREVPPHRQVPSIVKPAAVTSNASPENPSSFTRIPRLSL